MILSVVRFAEILAVIYRVLSRKTPVNTCRKSRTNAVVWRKSFTEPDVKGLRPFATTHQSPDIQPVYPLPRAYFAQIYATGFSLDNNE